METPRIQIPEKLEFLLYPKRYKVLYGGRGGLKSWTVAHALLALGMQRPLRIVCGRETQTSISDSVHKLLADRIRAFQLNWFYEVMRYTIVQRQRDADGSRTEFTFTGLLDQDVHNIKSLEGADILWIEEATKISEYAWDMIVPTIRKPGSEIWVTFNPDWDRDETYVRFVKRKRSDCIAVKTGWEDNPWLPEELRAEKDEMLRTSPVKYRNIWGGEPKTESQGALWTHQMITNAQVDSAAVPAIQRYVVAVDPATTAKVGSDMTGIGVAGLGVDQRVYVFADYTMRATPAEWTRKVGWAWGAWQADRVVAEVNNGGDLVEAALRSIPGGHAIPYRAVHASRGKLLRAEPVAALYEQGRVRHVNRYSLKDLEEQQCEWVPGVSVKSPDRIDWLCWAVYDLVLQPAMEQAMVYSDHRVVISPY